MDKGSTTSSASPVINFALSETKNTSASAISSGSPIRPRGILAIIFSLFPFGYSLIISLTTTLSPSRAKSIVIAFPMPIPAPVPWLLYQLNLFAYLLIKSSSWLPWD